MTMSKRPAQMTFWEAFWDVYAGVYLAGYRAPTCTVVAFYNACIRKRFT